MPYLLDTNVCVVYIRGQNALLSQRVCTPQVRILLCSVVKAELIRAAHRPGQRSTGPR